MTREQIIQLVRQAYNEGFTEGMKEHTHYNGGKPWYDSNARKTVEGIPQETSHD